MRFTALVIKMQAANHKRFFRCGDLDRKVFNSGLVLETNGIREYRGTYNGQQVYSFYDGKFVSTAEVHKGQEKNYCVSNFTTKSIDHVILKLLREKLDDDTWDDKVSYEAVQAPPGCGKTHYLVSRAQTGQTVLCTTLEGTRDLSSKLKVMNKDCDVRTINAFITSSLNTAKRSSADVVWIDEALMNHPATIFLVAHIARAKRVICV